MKNLKKMKNKDKSNNELNLEWIKENSSQKNLIKFFSYKFNIQDLSKAYKKNSLNEIVYLFSNPLLFNKHNKKTYFISFFFAVVLRILIFFFWLSFFYLLIYFFNKIEFLEFGSAIGIVFAFSVLIGFVYVFLLLKLTKISDKENNEYIKKRWIINTCLMNVLIWKIAKWIYKSSSVNINNLDNVRNKLKWEDFISDLIYMFKSTIELFFSTFATFKIENNIDLNINKKIKKCKDFKKPPKFFIVFIIIINFSLWLKFILSFFVPIIYASLSFSIFVIIHNL